MLRWLNVYRRCIYHQRWWQNFSEGVGDKLLFKTRHIETVSKLFVQLNTSLPLSFSKNTTYYSQTSHSILMQILPLSQSKSNKRNLWNMFLEISHHGKKTYLFRSKVCNQKNFTWGCRAFLVRFPLVWCFRLDGHRYTHGHRAVTMCRVLANFPNLEQCHFDSRGMSKLRLQKALQHAT